MGRKPCCSKEQELNRGAWTAMEDKILTEYIELHGEGKWRNLPERAGLKRCGKSCRLRWLNYLRPGIKRGSITEEEEDLIIRLHKLLGNRWALIAGRLPGRTDNEIKNYWHTKLSKTLKPKCDAEEQKSNPNKSSSSDHHDRPAKKQRLSEAEPSLEEDKILIKTSVVRTKATRFTKPVTVVPRTTEDHQHDQSSTTFEPFDQRSSSPSSAISEIGQLASSSHNHDHDHDHDQMMMMRSLEDESSCQGLNMDDFAVDFDVDNDFLSGLFNTDWISELPNCPENENSGIYISEIVVEGNEGSEQIINPELPLLMSSDLESIVSLIETDHLDSWLQV